MKKSDEECKPGYNVICYIGMYSQPDHIIIDHRQLMTEKMAAMSAMMAEMESARQTSLHQTEQFVMSTRKAVDDVTCRTISHKSSQEAR